MNVSNPQHDTTMRRTDSEYSPGVGLGLYWIGYSTTCLTGHMRGYVVAPSLQLSCDAMQYFEVGGRGGATLISVSGRWRKFLIPLLAFAWLDVRNPETSPRVGVVQVWIGLSTTFMTHGTPFYGPQVLFVLLLAVAWLAYQRLVLPMAHRSEQALEVFTAICDVLLFLVAFVLLICPVSGPTYRCATNWDDREGVLLLSILAGQHQLRMEHICLPAMLEVKSYFAFLKVAKLRMRNDALRKCQVNTAVDMAVVKNTTQLSRACTLVLELSPITPVPRAPMERMERY